MSYQLSSSCPGVIGFTRRRSIMLAGGMPAKLQFVSMLRLLIRLDRLAKVTISSESRSRSRASRRLSLSVLISPPWSPGSSDKCTLGASDVSAVDATYDELSCCCSPLRMDSGFVVEVCDTSSLRGTVLTLSECNESCESSSLANSTLLSDLLVLLSSRRFVPL